MATPAIYANPDQLAEVSARYDGVNRSLTSAHEKWEELASEIDQLETQN